MISPFARVITPAAHFARLGAGPPDDRLLARGGGLAPSAAGGSHASSSKVSLWQRSLHCWWRLGSLKWRKSCSLHRLFSHTFHFLQFSTLHSSASGRKTANHEVCLPIASLHGELLVEEKSRLDAMSTDMTAAIGW